MNMEIHIHIERVRSQIFDHLEAVTIEAAFLV